MVNPIDPSYMPGKLFSLLILAALLLSTSCIPQRRLTYLQDKHKAGNEVNAEIRKYRVQTSDILFVRIATSDPAVSEKFNIEEARTQRTATGAVGDPYMYIYGYSVDPEGNIKLPVLGTVKVAGYTLEEIEERILELTKEYLVDATITARLVNFKVTVLGEVNSPGTYNVYDTEFTVMDALGVAGDMTDYGKRRVHVVRKTETGRQFERIDLTDREAVKSELYYLQPNDLVYVEPMLAKRFALAQFPYSALFSAISTAILLFTFIQ